jgi:hypothetical protein
MFPSKMINPTPIFALKMNDSQGLSLPAESLEMDLFILGPIPQKAG